MTKTCLRARIISVAVCLSVESNIRLEKCFMKLKLLFNMNVSLLLGIGSLLISDSINFINIAINDQGHKFVEIEGSTCMNYA